MKQTNTAQPKTVEASVVLHLIDDWKNAPNKIGATIHYYKNVLAYVSEPQRRLLWTHLLKHAPKERLAEFSNQMLHIFAPQANDKGRISQLLFAMDIAPRSEFSRNLAAETFPLLLHWTTGKEDEVGLKSWFAFHSLDLALCHACDETHDTRLMDFCTPYLERKETENKGGTSVIHRWLERCIKDELTGERGEGWKNGKNTEISRSALNTLHKLVAAGFNLEGLSERRHTPLEKIYLLVNIGALQTPLATALLEAGARWDLDLHPLVKSRLEQHPFVRRAKILESMENDKSLKTPPLIANKTPKL